jgi:hypothetical protein
MAWFMAAMAGLQVAQGFGQASAMEAQADYQKTMSGINQRNAELQAKNILKQGGIDAIRTKKKINQIVGSQRAGFAAQGVDVRSGSAAMIQEETMEAGVEEIQSIRNNAFLTAMGYQAEAEERGRNARINALTAQGQAQQSILTGGLNAATTLNNQGYFDRAYKSSASKTPAKDK